MVTLYEILEVSEKASKEVMEKAYKTLAKKYHPDLQPNKEQKDIASEKMKKINEAYSVLSDDEKRRKYDEKLESDRKRMEARNINTDNSTNTNNRVNSNVYYNQANSEWRDELNHLTEEERKNIIKKIEKDAKKEYENMYRNYFRSRGYKVKYKISFKGICSLIITLCILAFVMWILWLIPVTRNYGIKLYQENIVIKILVDIIWGILKAFISTIKSIFIR